jgi:predicted TIM-barrel fold metal-dependent hydrolase
MRYKLGPKHSLERVDLAKELGFLGVKMFTPMEGYPHDKENCYPIYERCTELGLHVEIHTGVESCPGARFKYCDPMFINDIARDFPTLPIVQVHCGMVINPQMALWNCNLHANVYTDISGFHSRHNPKFSFNADLLRLMEEKIPDKVFFGSDFPVFLTTYDDILGWIKKLPVSAEFKRKLMRGNAEKFFLKREFEPGVGFSAA